MTPKPEDIAREKIDRMLDRAGWAVQNVKKVDIYPNKGVAIREFELKSGYGTVNYLLCTSMDLTPGSFVSSLNKRKAIPEMCSSEVQHGKYQIY